MDIKIWIIIAELIAIIIFILMYKESQSEINRKCLDIQKSNNDIDNLYANIREQNLSIQQLKTQIRENEKEGIKIKRAYLTAKGRSEVDIIEEIENSITEEYRQLFSSNSTATTYIASAMADYYTAKLKEYEKALKQQGQIYRSAKIADVRLEAAKTIQQVKETQYTYEFLLCKLLETYPEIDMDYIYSTYGLSANALPKAVIERESTGIKELKEADAALKQQLASSTMEQKSVASLRQEIDILHTKVKALESERNDLRKQVNDFFAFRDRRWPLLRESVEDYQKEYSSNLSAIPYMSRIIADIMTIDFDRLAWSLSWGNNQERKKKVASLYALKKEKSDEIERIKGAEYQLAYLLNQFPALQDVIDTDFQELNVTYDEITEHDPVINFIDKTEWDSLPPSQRNQLALNRYIESRKKSKWQIGRDYELYCGYCYETKGYDVDYYGSYHGLEDLGRDLIVKQGSETRIVQCKYWSKNKEIHEKHIMQLFGTVTEYNIVNNSDSTGILLTNTTLSKRAKEFAKILHISYKENLELDEFPRIKCNIGRDENGYETKIYHLPFDQQYDSTKIDITKGEFMAMTVYEAEAAGFRRAYRWHHPEV
ncbi:MAG: restriction endonuclease [Firmicutes bacterium]|nr:restriction endonuclease [Bacillota bacterium]